MALRAVGIAVVVLHVEIAVVAALVYGHFSPLPGIRGLESLAVAARRISQSTQSNQGGRLGSERRMLLRLLSFCSPLHTEVFTACLGE